MSERHNDRSVIAIWAACFIALCGLGLSGRCAAEAQTDGSAEPTVIRIRSGGATFGPYGDWHHQTIQPTDRARLRTDYTSLENDASAYWWVTWVSGPPACIFTAKPAGAQGSPLIPDTIGGGRDCTDDDGGHCGMFMPGDWWVYGASGGTCSAFGVEECTGWCQ